MVPVSVLLCLTVSSLTKAVPGKDLTVMEERVSQLLALFNLHSPETTTAMVFGDHFRYFSHLSICPVMISCFRHSLSLPSVRFNKKAPTPELRADSKGRVHSICLHLRCFLPFFPFYELSNHLSPEMVDGGGSPKFWSKSRLLPRKVYWAFPWESLPDHGGGRSGAVRDNRRDGGQNVQSISSLHHHLLSCWSSTSTIWKQRKFSAGHHQPSQGISHWISCRERIYYRRWR